MNCCCTRSTSAPSPTSTLQGSAGAPPAAASGSGAAAAPPLPASSAASVATATATAAPAAGPAGATAQASSGVAALGTTAPTKLHWPVAGSITDVFGAFQSWRTEAHTGLDIGAATGTPITAAEDGEVVEAGWMAGGGGNVTVIRHAGNLYTAYAHQSAIDVSVGDRVKAGDRIGAVGSTGNTTGPHLHFAVHVGSKDAPPVDPMKYLPKR